MRTARRLTQLFFLALFVFIVLGAHGIPTAAEWGIDGPINPHVVFLSDPFTWVSASLAARMFIAQLPWLVLILLVLTLLFGRVFCGWVCPLGTVIDGTGRVVRPRGREIKASRRRREHRESSPFGEIFGPRTKYYLLVFILVLAALGSNVSGWFDPLAILMRGTVFALAPVGEWLFEQSAGRLSEAPVAGGFYYWAKDNAFGPIPQVFAQGWLHLAVLIAVLALTRIRRRYWCQVLCPLGAFWGLVARVGVWKRRVNAEVCNECSICGLSCRMEAIDSEHASTVDGGECLRCGECADACPSRGIAFAFPALSAETAKVEARPERFQLTRRGVLAAVGSSVVAFPLLRLTSSARAAAPGAILPGQLDAFLIRPPGARDEERFLELCIRCGECFKICPQNALHPVLFQAGLEGLWTPAVVARIGYCEPTCTLCTQVCPTTAIQPLHALEKPVRGRIGVAVFDRSRCLPWAKGISCSVCEEMCPVSPKAIQQRRVTVRSTVGDEVEVPAPVVLEERCTGCGACENKCPVEGTSPVRVVRTAATSGASAESALPIG